MDFSIFIYERYHITLTIFPKCNFSQILKSLFIFLFCYYIILLLLNFIYVKFIFENLIINLFVQKQL